MALSVHVGEDNLIEWDKLTLASNASYVNNATVTFALKSEAGATLATGSLSYVAGSNGKYQGTLDRAAVALVAGTLYYLELTATRGADDGFRRIRSLARYHAEEG